MADTVLELIRASTDFLAKKNITSARLDAELLLADLLKCERIQLYARFDSAVDSGVKDSYRQRIVERGKNRPTAQILGYKYFYNNKFIITDNVLIPRPETEQIVSIVLEAGLPDDSRILDLCCGSGCIGLSLLKEKPGWSAHLSDISPEALKVAGENSKNLGVESRSQFFTGDLYENLPGSKYNAIVVNPPYIHPDEKSELMSDVRDFEPAAALFHDSPPDLYEKIFSDAALRLSEGGIFCAELSPRWAETAASTAGRFFSRVEIRKDDGGLERYLLARMSVAVQPD